MVVDILRIYKVPLPCTLAYQALLLLVIWGHQARIQTLCLRQQGFYAFGIPLSFFGHTVVSLE